MGANAQFSGDLWVPAPNSGGQGTGIRDQWQLQHQFQLWFFSSEDYLSAREGDWVFREQYQFRFFRKADY